MSSGLNGSLGALEIGSVLGAFLFGIETLQTYNYYRDFSRDCVLLRSTVIGDRSSANRFLELGHTVSSWHALYSETVTLYGEPQHISSPPLSEDLTVLLTALIYIVVQTFFANRVRILSGSWLLHGYVLITVSMCYYLQKMRWSTESTRARKMVERLMVWTIVLRAIMQIILVRTRLLVTTRTDREFPCIMSHPS
ncbi:hypothetical protein B0H14DRAFT_2915886 [Mycena olivaceomarginata]|nr:hypothetical protein B0H14DRAFT_2915886 [Mycena olivaceomarginata]